MACLFLVRPGVYRGGILGGQWTWGEIKDIFRLAVSVWSGLGGCGRGRCCCGQEGTGMGRSKGDAVGREWCGRKGLAQLGKVCCCQAG